MKRFFTHHRAALGLLGFLALLVDAALPDPEGAFAIWDIAHMALILAMVVGAAAILTSPYWKILYAEAPLRRAMTGVSDLDERELALRDRANGLTYYLFATANVLLILGLAFGMKAGLLTAPAADLLLAAVMPYVFFAIGLPVFMLEWFEPSAPAGDAIGEEE